MRPSKEALEIIKTIQVSMFGNSDLIESAYKEECETINQDLDRLEKLEKAIEIILKYDIDLLKVKQFSYEGYVGYCNFVKLLIPTQEEYNLLEEVIKCQKD